MAEKTEKKSEPPAAEKAAAGGAEKKAAKGGFLTKTPVLLGGVMVLEAAVLFAGFKLLGGKPKTVTGAELTTTEKPAAAESSGEGGGGGEGEGAPAGGAAVAPTIDPGKPCEIEVLEFRSPNKISGRLYLYDVSIYAVTKGEHLDKVKAIIQDREALIKDRVRTIIAEMDPEKLGGGSEPGLETLRRQVKFQLDEIVGDGLIDEVLIPKCIPYRSDF